MKKVYQRLIIIPLLSAMILTGLSLPSTAIKAEASTVGVKYKTHVQSDGDQSYVADGKTSGTSGRSLRLEGIWIELTGSYSGGISYKTHVQDVGWQSSVSNGAMSGTSGKSKRLEGISISLTGDVANNYDVYYRVHAQDYGWMAWAKNGALAGSEGLSKRLEGIQIILVAKGGSGPGNINSVTSVYSDPYVTGALYRTHVQNVGWQGYVGNAKTSGTSGRSLRLEGINIKLTSDIDGGITYRTHVQNDGWQAWKSNGTMAGTSGRSLRLEAIEIKLTGNAASNYDIYYRTHVQNVGWQGWVKNGAAAGTSGSSLRLEAIEIKLVKKTSSTVDVTGVSISGNSSVTAGSTITLTGSVTPSNATDKTLTWSSSNTSVATVSSSGVVTGKAAGMATITAAASNGVMGTKSITVTAASTAVTGVTISGGSSGVYVGSTLSFTAEVTPSTAADKTITWSSSNTSVATINSSGVLTAVKEGTVIITAKASNGVSATKSVTVYAIDVTGVSVTGTALKVTNSGAYCIIKGGTANLSTTVTPSNATYPTVTWSSSDTSVATVDSSGKVTGVNGGTAYINAKTSNGKNDTVTIVVQGGTFYKDKTYTVDLSGGKTATVTGHLVPEYATQLMTELNQYRVENGRMTLSTTDALSSFAQTRVIEIAYNFSHSRPNGESLGSSVNGENITMFTNISGGNSNFKASPEHNANMLTEAYTKGATAIFAVKNTDLTSTSCYFYYYVQVFQL